MIQLIYWPLDQSWHLVINLPPPPEPEGWWYWWYLLPMFTIWSMGVGIASKVVYGWNSIGEWDLPTPLVWPLGLPYFIGARLTKRWLIWRDYRKNCKLSAKTNKTK